MILDSDVFSIGRFTRTHGIHGEIEVHFTDDVFDRGEADYVFLKIDGLYVPFFLEDYRFKGANRPCLRSTASTATPLRANSWDTRSTIPSMPARPRTKTRFRRSAPSRGSVSSLSTSALAETAEGGDETSEDGVPTLELGTVKHVETTTANTLLTVEVEGGEDVLLPLHDDFVVDYDLRERYLVLDVPEGLIDLND